jgi:hypothetical protein
LLEQPQAVVTPLFSSRAMEEIAQSLAVLFECHDKGVLLLKSFIDYEMTKASTSQGIVSFF